jgi:hypothetical protein
LLLEKVGPIQNLKNHDSVEDGFLLGFEANLIV